MKKLILFLVVALFTGSVFAQDEEIPAKEKEVEVKVKVKEKDKDREKEKEKEKPKSDISEILDSMSYPELQVVPRATERLSIESKLEDSSYFFTHWPIELAGLGTLYIGLTDKSHQRTDLTAKEKKDANSIAMLTTAVGAGWVIGGALLGAERPYYHGQKSLTKYPGKDERSTLLRERLAEEALERPARTMRVLQNLAVITNVGVNLASAIHANDNGRVQAGMVALISFLPLMFEDHNILVYDKHIEYKKKIYAPLKSASFHYDPTTHTLTPMSNLTWLF